MSKKTPKMLAKVGKSATKKAHPIAKKPILSTDTIGVGYSDAEFLSWSKKWSEIPGMPGFVRKGQASDGYYGVAIFHPDGADLLVSHTCYSSRAMRDLYVRGLVFLYKSGKE